MQIGTVLYASWGYGQTNVDFFEVTKVTRCSVEVRKLDKRVTSIDGATIHVVPVIGTFVEEAIRRRPRTSTYDGSPIVNVNSFTFAQPWNGRPMRATHPAYGY